MARVSLVSLGCPKNLVDSEGALGEIARAGHEITANQSEADVIVVNTCGFIEDARAESVEAILRAVEHKKSGRCKGVVVIGCLSQRYSDSLTDELPGVDVVLGVGHAGKVAGAVEDALAGRKGVDDSAPPSEWLEHSDRIVSTQPWTAYIQICDGCNNRCSYCAIPDIRGPFRSRPEELVVDEARRLADAGVRELILVGQDITQYGADWDASNSLPGLIEKLNTIEDLVWIRLLYCYPTKITPELIEAVASSDKVVKYLDIPLQHGDDEILRAMNRRGTVGEYLDLIDRIRSRCSDIALRSSFIVGFPGETETRFDNLLRFVEKIKFDRVGVFQYSREDGTPASGFKKRVGRKAASSRYDRLMSLQQGISVDKHRSFIGRNLEVLVEGECEDGMYGRSYRDAPEIDGVVYLPGIRCESGRFVDVTITGATEYDLVGSTASSED